MKDRLRAWPMIRLAMSLIFLSLLGISARDPQISRLLNQAKLALERNQPVQAAEITARAATYPPERTDLWELAGNYALQGGEARIAIGYFQLAEDSGDLSPNGIMLMGDAARSVGDLDTSIQSWQIALNLGVPPEEIYPRLYEVHRQLGEFSIAEQDLRELAELQPSNALWQYQLGLILAALQPESALAYLTHAANLDPALAQAARTIGQSIQSARRVDNPAFTYLSSGRALASLDEWELAAEAFNQATQLSPGFAEAWAFLGEAQQQLGKDGLFQVQKALDLDPDSVAANMFMAIYWQRRDHPERALVYYHTAALNDPRNPVLQVELGNTLASLGNLSDALKHYQQAAELAPRDPSFQRSLANFSIKYEYQTDQVGLPAARQAVLFDPKDPISLDLLAQFYLLKKDPLLAQRFLDRALQFDPGYPEARLHLGLVYILQGKVAEARHEFTLARELSTPNSPVAELARRLLEYYRP